MKKQIVFLDAKTMGDIDLSIFSRFGEYVEYNTSSPAEVVDRIKNATIVISNKAIVGVDAIRNAPDLKLICVAATGMNNVDLAFAAENGIVVKNVKGYSTESVAQHTFSLLFGMTNKVIHFDKYVKDKEGYCKSDIFSNFSEETWEIEGKTIGIIGLGAIGRRVAELATAFGAKVIYYSTSGENNNPNYSSVPLNELMSSADVVSIHAPLNDRTKGIIDFQSLSLMKKTAVLINTGRGGIVDEAALARALNEEILAMAALDVFEQEPINETNPLLNLKDPSRMIFSPHIAWASKEARGRLLRGIVENISSFI